MKRIGVMTSGGDAPGMNAAIRAVVRCGIARGMEVYGIRRGYEGLIDNEIVRLYLSDAGGIMHRGGTFLGTARSERFRTEEGQNRAKDVLDMYGIEGLVVIGGNGSLTGAIALSDRGIKVMGLPGTIDNDLSYTDFSIGFDTAVNTCLDAISKIRDTSSSHDRNTVIEVMGRECGDIAIYAGMTGGAEMVLVPEMDYDIDDVVAKVMSGIRRGKTHSIIIKAEGSKGTTREITDKIQKLTGRETREVVLSYLQRGGSPTAKDRMIATLTGAKAVELLDENSESMAIGIRDNRIAAYPLREALEMPKRNNFEAVKDLVDVLSK